MPEYRRAYTPGGTVFLTLATHNRIPIFANFQNIVYLRSAVATMRSEIWHSLAHARRRPFDSGAIGAGEDAIASLIRFAAIAYSSFLVNQKTSLAVVLVL
jgi:hypothetical protein